MPNKELQLYSCEYVMDTALQRTPFIVDRLLAPGLYILAGAPKVGKSWLVLDLCLSVAEGRDFLGQRTEKGQVVYLALEDSLIRLQNGDSPMSLRTIWTLLCSLTASVTAWKNSLKL